MSSELLVDDVSLLEATNATLADAARPTPSDFVIARPMIEVAHLGKDYRKFELTKSGEDGSMRAVLARVLRTQRGGTGASHALAAVDDVSFTINAGETVGLVGRNGAGKSTLLKMLSLVTTPTKGRIALAGRVGSLLELGIGFHADLTGRENVYVSSAMYGMGRAETAKRLEAIVDFAELEAFIDTPLRHYSSGMRARLGYAVASHVDADILIVDEALSVGDIAFQSKCVAHAGRMAASGRAVILVSHNSSLLATLCQRGLLLDRGRLLADGPIESVLETYLRLLDQAKGEHVADVDSTARNGVGDVRAIAVTLHPERLPAPSVELVVGEAVRIDIALTQARPGLRCRLNIMSAAGRLVSLLDSASGAHLELTATSTASTHPRVSVDVPELLLPPGSYSIGLRVEADGELQDVMPRAATFHVGPGHVRGRRVGFQEGDVVLPHHWRHNDSTAGAPTS
jgi:lipopolysaccharide transport system ATP-binding protein